MITSFILLSLAGLMELVYNTLPSWSFNLNSLGITVDPSFYSPYGVAVSSYNDPFSVFFAICSMFNAFLPIDHMLVIGTLIAAVYVAIGAWKFVKKIIGWIRGSGTD